MKQRRRIKFGTVLGAVAALLILVSGAIGGATQALAADPPVPTVSVQGQGIVSAQPDVVILNLGVSVEAESVAAARSQAASASTAVLAVLQADGVAERDIRTVQFSIGPRYDTVNNRQILRGYRVDNVVQVKIRALDTVGNVIDDAAAVGGDAVVVQNISFAIENTDAVAHQARLAAMQDAKSKADDYAGAIGMTAGKALTIKEETSVQPTPQLAAAAPAGAVARSTPIEAGMQQVRVAVTVTFALQ